MQFRYPVLFLAIALVAIMLLAGCDVTSSYHDVLVRNNTSYEWAIDVYGSFAGGVMPRSESHILNVKAGRHEFTFTNLTLSEKGEMVQYTRTMDIDEDSVIVIE